MNLMLVMIGGALGAVCRFLVGHAVTPAPGRPLPWGTLIVNITGALLLGLIAGAAGSQPGWVGPLVGTGFCGALTTYSTFSYETLRLLRSESAGWRWALLNVTATLIAGFGAVALGGRFGSAI
ncbi:MAG TPA: fluoride efflux transporter CrcB [Micromonosporaceae bacterium]|nr:fluoride efflux transporter CrcB [Micromonosporaceae bacterium]